MLTAEERLRYLRELEAEVAAFIAEVDAKVDRLQKLAA